MKTKVKYTPEINLLFKIVQEETQYSKKDVKSKYRFRELVNARIVSYAVLDYILNYNTSQIAYILNRDHSSVIHYRKKHIDHYKYDKKYKFLYDKIKRAIYSKINISLSPELLNIEFNDLLKNILETNTISEENKKRAVELIY